jgi:uncharacterized phage-associated protein
MSAAAVNTAFEIAFRLLSRAHQDSVHLQPQKLHCLLLLAQGCYAARYGGRPLMPAVFVADPRGPIEPNLHAAFSRGCPDLDLDGASPNEAVETLIEGLWRRFGQLPAAALVDLVKDLPACREAVSNGERSEIPLPLLAHDCADQRLLGNGMLAGRRVLRTQSGRPVRVAPWQPGRAVSPPTRTLPPGA